MNTAIKIKFKSEVFNPVYMPFYKCSDRYLLLYGGAGSGKSEFAAAKILIRMLSEKGHRFLICRKVAKTIRNSQYELLREVVNRWNVSSLFDFKDGELRVTCKRNGNEIISAGLDDVEKLKSITGISGIWVEEMTELLPEDWRQLNLRMRGWRLNYKQTIGTFNPIDENHWIRKEFFHDGEMDNNIYRFERRTEFGTLTGTTLRTTYRDNKFLDDTDRAALEALEQEDENYYRIYALGLWGAQTKGLVYKKWSIVDKLPTTWDFEIYGLDFGFSNPCALVRVLVKDGAVYLQQKIYKRGLTNSALIKLCDDLGIDRKSAMYGDAASPDKIQEFYEHGYNIFPADKAVNDGIGFCQNFHFYTSDDSTDLHKEFRTYKWKVDKNGNQLEEPLKFNDHIMDAIRYALYTHKKMYPMAFQNKPAPRIIGRKKERIRENYTQGF